jgi:hypothetical protein
MAKSLFIGRSYQQPAPVHASTGWTCATSTVAVPAANTTATAAKVMSFLIVASYQQVGLAHAMTGATFIIRVAAAPAASTKATAANAMSFFFMKISRAHGMQASIGDATRAVGSKVRRSLPCHAPISAQVTAQHQITTA